MDGEPRFHELFTILIRLERREQYVRDQLDRLRERVGTFPNEVTLRKNAELAAEHGALLEQIQALRERLKVT